MQGAQAVEMRTQQWPGAGLSQAVRRPPLTDAVEHPVDEVEVHPTDELAVLVGEPVEGAVGESDLIARVHLGHRAAVPGPLHRPTAATRPVGGRGGRGRG